MKQIQHDESGIVVVIIIFLSLAVIFATKAIKWENAQVNYEDGFIEYEVVIWNDRDVMLYNTNNVTDSRHLRLKNSNNLFGEWMIQVHK